MLGVNAHPVDTYSGYAQCQDLRNCEQRICRGTSELSRPSAPTLGYAGIAGTSLAPHPCTLLMRECRRSLAAEWRSLPGLSCAGICPASKRASMARHTLGAAENALRRRDALPKTAPCPLVPEAAHPLKLSLPLKPAAHASSAASSGHGSADSIFRWCLCCCQGRPQPTTRPVSLQIL